MNEGEPRIDFWIRKEIKEQRGLAVKTLKREKEGGRVGWAVYDSPVKFYDNLFELPDGYKKILDYLDGEYKEKLGDLVGIELGGPGSQLFKDLNESKRRFIKSVGVALADARYDNAKQSDKLINHEVIEANVFSTGFTGDGDIEYSGFEKVEDWVDKNGHADLILEMMHLPIHRFKAHSELFFNSVLRWYRLLSEKGTLLVQGPKFATNFLDEIKVELKKVGIQFDYRVTSDELSYISIRKLEGSPDNLDNVLRNLRLS